MPGTGVIYFLLIYVIVFYETIDLGHVETDKIKQKATSGSSP